MGACILDLHHVKSLARQKGLELRGDTRRIGGTVLNLNTGALCLHFLNIACSEVMEIHLGRCSIREKLFNLISNLRPIRLNHRLPIHCSVGGIFWRAQHYLNKVCWLESSGEVRQGKYL